MINKPLVSIIMPVYNSKKFLREAIESALSTSTTEIELIIVDDGSTDGSREIAASYQSVRIIKQERSGACKARNVGIKHATGEFVKFLDSDDVLEPTLVSKQVALLHNLDKKFILYSDIRFFDNISGEDRVHVVDLNKNGDQLLQLLRSNIQTSAPLHRRASLLEIGGFDERLLKAQEYNLHLRLSMAGYKFLRLPGIVTHVREHDDPNRITNQRVSHEARENAELRSTIYLELFRAHYGASIPPAIRRHFASGAAEAALKRIRCGDVVGAWRELRYADQFDPSAADLLIGCGEAIKRIAGFKWRRVLARLMKG